MLKEVVVQLDKRSYPVLVGSGARNEIARFVPPGTKCCAIVTQQVLIDNGWVGQLNLGIPAEILLVDEGERAKNLTTVERLCRQFAQYGLSRDDLVVSLGGGVVSDIAGFAASSYHRGVSVVNVATTLLAQVDAAVGGKTGVNLPEGKNLVGAFWQPHGVICDTDMLSTLDDREVACGKGEIAKYVFLDDADSKETLMDLDLDAQIARCVKIKALVVAGDERESSRRMLLNYGHTLAHALEAVAFQEDSIDEASQLVFGLGPRNHHLDLRHGEAVAVGLMFAANLAYRLGRIDKKRVDYHQEVISAFGLSFDLPLPIDSATLVEFMLRDKKAQHNLTFVLDGKDGLDVVRDVSLADVTATLKEMGAS